MDTKILKNFLQIANDGNMTKSSEFLKISQPTLSRQIRGLEKELGIKIFERGNHKMSLTAEGLILRQHAEEILTIARKTESEFKNTGEIVKGDIHIGCAESCGMSAFINKAKTLNNKHPFVGFHFYSGDTRDVEILMSKGILDMAVIVQDVDMAKYNYIELPSNDIWGAVIRKDSPLALKETIELDDIIQYPLIVSRQGLETDLMPMFGERKKELKVVATYNLFYNASVMVKEGLGVAIALSGLINTDDNCPLCFRPISPVIKSPLYVIWKKYQTLTTAAKLLIDELKTAGF